MWRCDAEWWVLFAYIWACLLKRDAYPWWPICGDACCCGIVVTRSRVFIFLPFWRSKIYVCGFINQIQLHLSSCIWNASQTTSWSGLCDRIAVSNTFQRAFTPHQPFHNRIAIMKKLHEETKGKSAQSPINNQHINTGPYIFSDYQLHIDVTSVTSQYRKKRFVAILFHCDFNCLDPSSESLNQSIVSVVARFDLLLVWMFILHWVVKARHSKKTCFNN